MHMRRSGGPTLVDVALRGYGRRRPSADHSARRPATSQHAQPSELFILFYIVDFSELFRATL